MKTLKYNTIYTLLLAAVLVLAAGSCDDKEEDEDLALSRRFRPALVAATNGETQVKLEWLASLFTVPGDVDYVLEVSRDPASFDNPEYSTTTKETAVVITDNQLAIKQDYFVRIKAVGASGAEDSKWTVAGPFRILGEQFLVPVAQENIIDRAVRLTWRENAELSKIVITGPSGPSIEVSLTDADKAQGFKQVDNLQQTTLYTVEIFAGTKSKGVIQFTTKAGLTGKIIDLRGVTGKLSIIADTLPDVESGSVIVLKRGTSYTLPSFSLNKSLTFISGLDFGGAQPVLKTTSNFTIPAGATVDSLVFKDVYIRGGKALGASYLSDYVLNVNATNTAIKKIRFEDCKIEALRGVVRAQSGAPGTKIDNLLVNNCVIDSLREYGLTSISGGSSLANIRVTNSTVTEFRKLIVHGVAGNESVRIENCTFNEGPAGGASATTNFFIDFTTNFNSGGVTITNCIFGATWNEGGTAGTLSSGFRAGATTTANVTSCYNTSDFVNNSFAIPGLSAYTAPSTSVFESPSTGNFKIKDSGFPGKNAGDPRWR